MTTGKGERGTAMSGLRELVAVLIAEQKNIDWYGLEQENQNTYLERANVFIALLAVNGVVRLADDQAHHISPDTKERLYEAEWSQPMEAYEQAIADMYAAGFRRVVTLEL